MENDKKQNILERGLFPFDPIVLFRNVARRWMLILLVVILAGASAYISTNVKYQPVYHTKITWPQSKIHKVAR